MDNFLDSIRSEIVLIVEQTIQKYMKDNKYEKPYDGKIIAEQTDNDGNLCYDVNLGFVTLYKLKNKTGEESLKPGDCVTVYTKGGNINNSYIGIKF